MKGHVIMKTEKELQELKEKVEEINEELRQFADDELEQVSGGKISGWAQSKLQEYG